MNTHYPGTFNRRDRRAAVSNRSAGRGDAVVAKLLKLAYPATLTCAALSTVLSAGYVGTSLATDGISGLDGAIVAASSISFFAISAVLHHTGVHVLPQLEGDRRRTGIAAWFAAMTLVVSVSFPTGVLFMAEPIASAAQFEDGVNTVLNQAADASAAAREIQALIPPAANAGKTAGGMKARERASGAVSDIGSGTGIVTDALASIEIAALSAEKALVSSRASASPLVRRVNELTGDIRKLVNSPDLTLVERSAAAKDKIVELGLVIEALRQTAPVEAIRNLIDGLSKDWQSIGLNEQAASAVQQTFEPVATQFTLALDDIRQNADKPIKHFVEKSGFPLLVDRAGEVFPIAVFVLLLDLLVVILVTLVLIVHRRPEEELESFSGSRSYDGPTEPAFDAVRLLDAPDRYRRGGGRSNGAKRPNGRA